MFSFWGEQHSDMLQEKRRAQQGPMDAHVTLGNTRLHRSTWLQVQSRERGSKGTSMDCKKLIVSALSPQVSVYCSEEADSIATQFGYHSFFQMLKPFGDKIEHKFQFKDSHLATSTADDYSLRFVPPLHELWSVQEAQSGPKAQLFSHQSLELLMSEYIQLVNEELLRAGQEKNKELQQVLKDSIYTKFFTKLLSSSTITPFESINHPVSSFLFINSNQSYEQARQLLIQLKNSKLPEYLNVDDILPVFIVIHDVKSTEEYDKAMQLKEHIKKQLYVETFLLGLEKSTDSQTTTLNAPILSSVEEELQNTHLAFESTPSLPSSNVTTIYKLLKEIIQKKLIPFMENKIGLWDEQVITPRRSITGRLFNVSKKYFGSKNSNQNENTSNFNPEKGYYGNQATEALTRKLADWAFMLRDYRYAYTTYELAKKDFLTDKAWSHLASTSEMAAISLLMGAANITSKLKNDTIDPLLDNANYTYLARCGLKTYALRSILIVAELFCTLRDSWSNVPTAIKWVQKALNDKLVSKVGKSLLLERISYFYSVCITAQAKVIMNKKLIGNKPHDEDEFVNPNKLRMKNVATIGYMRPRKAALWSLIAARNWDPVSRPLQVKMCLEQTRETYGDMTISKREGSLYNKLHDAAEKKLIVIAASSSGTATEITTTA